MSSLHEAVRCVIVVGVVQQLIPITRLVSKKEKFSQLRSRNVLPHVRENPRTGLMMIVVLDHQVQVIQGLVLDPHPLLVLLDLCLLPLWLSPYSPASPP